MLNGLVVVVLPHIEIFQDLRKYQATSKDEITDLVLVRSRLAA